MSDEMNSEPFYDGLPVIVRLLSGEDVICVAYQDDDQRVLIERPLRIMYEVSENIPDSHTSSGVNFAKVRTRFERWMPFSDANMFPVDYYHVVSIAPLSEQFINAYMEWSSQLYQDSAASYDDTFAEDLLTDDGVVPAPGPDATEEEKQSYNDFLLHNLNTKGKPN